MTMNSYDPRYFDNDPVESGTTLMDKTVQFAQSVYKGISQSKSTNMNDENHDSDTVQCNTCPTQNKRAGGVE